MAQPINPLSASNMLNPLLDTQSNPLVRNTSTIPTIGSIVGNHDMGTAFMDTTYRIGENLANVGTALSNDISLKIGANPKDNKMFKGLAGSLLEMRKENGYIQSDEMSSVKNDIKAGHYGDAIGHAVQAAPEIIGASLPYSVAMAVDPTKVGLMTADYAYEAASRRKEEAVKQLRTEVLDIDWSSPDADKRLADIQAELHRIDKTNDTITALDLLKATPTAVQEAMLDRLGFGGQVSAIKNIASRALFSKAGAVNTLKDLTKATLYEGVTESAQELLESGYAKTGDVWSSGLLDSRTYSNDNLAGIAAAGLMGAVAGGGTSSVGTVIPRAIADTKSMFSSKAKAEEQMAKASQSRKSLFLLVKMLWIESKKISLLVK